MRSGLPSGGGVAGWPPGTTRSRLVTSQRDYRYIVVPVSFANGTPGGLCWLRYRA